MGTRPWVGPQASAPCFRQISPGSDTVPYLDPMKVLACQNPTSMSLPTCLEQTDSWSSGLILCDRSVASDRPIHSLLLETSSSLGSLGSLAVSPCFSPYLLTRPPQCPLQAPIPLPLDLSVLDLSVSGLGHGHSSLLLQDPPHTSRRVSPRPSLPSPSLSSYITVTSPVGTSPSTQITPLDLCLWVSTLTVPYPRQSSRVPRLTCPSAFSSPCHPQLRK